MIKSINKFLENAQILKKKARKCELKESTNNIYSKGALTAVVDAEQSSQVWSDEVMECIQDLIDTAEVHKDNCVGLAANQIWDKSSDPLSIFIVKLIKPTAENENNHYWQEFINPEIKTSGKSFKLEEQCLSVDKPKRVRRESNVTITFCTKNSNTPVTIKYYLKNNLMPIILQHEGDHLNGKII